MLELYYFLNLIKILLTFLIWIFIILEIIIAYLILTWYQIFFLLSYKLKLIFSWKFNEAKIIFVS